MNSKKKEMFIEKLSSKEFERLLYQRLNAIEDVLAIKAREYSDGEDRLLNFNEGSMITGKCREAVLDGFLLKHYVSYRKMLREAANNVHIDPAFIKEKFGDIINYFILQEVQFLHRFERNGNNATEREGSSVG